MRSIIPYTVDNPNAHILSDNGDNKKTLVTNIPWDSMFALDKQFLDHTSCVLFACQEEMYFGIGQRSSENDEALNRFSNITMQACF